MSRSALAPRMIGRQPQLQELEEQLRLARAGLCRVVLLAGDAGVGKTRLLRTLLERARSQPGIQILQGYCFEEYPPAAYGSFAGALRDFMRAHGPEPMIRAAGPLAGDLLPLLPELGLPSPGPVIMDDAQSRKQRLFEALYRVLRPQGAAQCRVLVLEDLHWADQTSLELLRYLARAAEREALLLLGTYRADEVTLSHPLHHALVQLTRDRLLHEVSLPPLTTVEVAQMIDAIIGRGVPDPFLATMADRTGGNPFFVEEVLSSLLDAGTLDAAMEAAQRGRHESQLLIPRSIRDSIHGRTRDLDEATIDVLRYAAVVGRHFDLQLLGRVTVLAATALIGAVSRLVERQLVVEERGSREDRYSFRHALSREAIYDELLGLDRRRRHRAVLGALEELHPEDREPVLDQLAYHSLQAHEEAKAVHYARLAGDRSARMFAFREAMGHYQTALELLDTEDPRERAELLEQLAEVAYPLGDSSVYGRCWQEAMRLYQEPWRSPQVRRPLHPPGRILRG